MYEEVEIGLKDYFKERMWSLRPFGCDYESAYKAFVEIIRNGSDEIENVKPTKEILINRYSKYLQAKALMAKNNGDFRDKRVESIHSWLMQNIWKQNFNYTPTDNPERDKYLYGI